MGCPLQTPCFLYLFFGILSFPGNGDGVGFPGDGDGVGFAGDGPGLGFEGEGDGSGHLGLDGLGVGPVGLVGLVSFLRMSLNITFPLYASLITLSSTLELSNRHQ